MASKADISAKVGLEGEQELKNNLKQINSSLKTLSSEAKMVASSFNEETTAEEKAAKQAEVLNKQITTQKDKLRVLEEALKQSADKYGESDERTQKWQRSIYDTQTELNKLEQELRKNEKVLQDAASAVDSVDGSMSNLQSSFADGASEASSMTSDLSILEKALLDIGDASADMKADLGGADLDIDDFKQSADEAADSIEQASSNTLDFGDVLDANIVSEAVKSGFSYLIKLAKDAASALKDCSIAGATFADDILTQSIVTGLSTDTLQEFKYMADLVDVSLETITGSLTKVTKSMKSAEKGSGDAYEAYKTLDVSVRDSNGVLRKNEDVFYDVLAALKNVKNETKREQLAMSLLGKSAKELNPLIEADEEALSGFRKEAKDTGYILSGSMLKSLGKTQDSLDRLSRVTEAAKNRFSAGMAPAVEKVSNALSNKLADPKIQRAITGLADVVGNLLVGALKLAELATGGLVDELGKLGYDIPEMSDEVKTLIDHTDSLRESADLLSESYDDSAKSILDEKARVEELWKELQTLTTETGYVTDADKDRAQYLLGELNSALGTEYEMNGNIITQYGEMKQSIADLIEQKTAMALLDAGQSRYGEAVLNLDSNRKDIAKYTKEINQAYADLETAKRQYENNIKFRNENLLNPDEWDKYNAAAEQYKQNYIALLGDIDTLTGKLDAAEQLEKQYTATIATYGEAMEASAEGNNARVIEIMSTGLDEVINYREKRGKVTDEDIAQIKQQIEDQKILISEYQKNMNAGLTGYDQEGFLELIGDLGNLNAILDATGRGAKTWEEVFSAEFRYAEKEVTSAAEDMADSVETSTDQMAEHTEGTVGTLISTIRQDYAPKAEDTGESLGWGTARGFAYAIKEHQEPIWDELDAVSYQIRSLEELIRTDGEILGHALDEGVSGGIDDYVSHTIYAAKNMIRQACEAAKKEAKINSPSKVTEQFGKYIALGLAEGMDDETGTVMSAAKRMTDAALTGSYNNGYTTSGIGSSFPSSSSYTTNMGGISVYVSGAGVANVDQLADKVASKLTTQLRRAQRAR